MRFLKLPLLVLFVGLMIPSLGRAATITVNTTIDEYNTGPSCSLREAIQSVNTSADFGGCIASGSYNSIDTINLPSDASHYELSLCSNDDDNSGEDLNITKDVQIVGGGADTTIVDAQPLSDHTPTPCPNRVLEIQNIGTPPVVVLSGMTLENGHAQDKGGGILNANDGNLTLNNVTVIQNQTAGVNSGGGIANNDGATLTIQNNSLIQGNSADLHGGGISNDNGFLTINDSRVSGNSTPYLGAGIFHKGVIDQTLTINNSSIDGNFFTPNSESVPAHLGAGLFINFDATITNSTISNNGFVDGQNGVLAEQGGGIFYNLGELNIVNSTISGNMVSDQGGGIFVGANEDLFAIKFEVIPQTVGLFNVTIANNSTTNETKSAGGGGIFVLVPLQPVPIKFIPVFITTPVSLSNTLIATNTGDQGPDCFGPVISDQGYNLLGINDGNCSGLTDAINGDQVGSTGSPINPLLGDLGENGGPTKTQALLFETNPSPAIDQGNPAGCLDQNGALLTQDQRGSTRPVNALGLPTAVCDIGAFEFKPQPSPSPTPTPPPPPPPPPVTLYLEGSGNCLKSQLVDVPVSASMISIWMLPLLWVGIWRCLKRK